MANIQIIGGSGNRVNGDVANLTLINCTDFEGTYEHNGRTYVENGRVIPNKSKVINASASENVDGSYSIYYVDTTAGNVNAIVDIAAIKDVEITFIITDDTHDLIFQTASNSENMSFESLPFTANLAKGDSIKITSDGTDIFITAKTRTQQEIMRLI